MRTLWEHPQAFGSYLEVKGFKKGVTLVTTSCAFLVWKPFQGTSQDKQNRISCETGYFWTEKGQTRQGEATMILSLADDAVQATGTADDPSFSIEGPLAKLLTQAVKKYAIPVDKNLNSTTMICAGSACAFNFPPANAKETKISLGENAAHVLAALCTSRVAPDEGACPEADTIAVTCDYVGPQPAGGSWGTLSEASTLVCNYETQASRGTYKLALGPVIVSSIGSRYSATEGVTVKGPGLTKLYLAIRSYALIAQNVENEENPLQYGELPNQAPYAPEHVSLAQSDTDVFTVLDCEPRDVSKAERLNEPQQDDGYPNGHRFSCRFEYKRLSPLGQ